jgi:hypothetical protein
LKADNDRILAQIHGDEHQEGQDLWTAGFGALMRERSRDPLSASPAWSRKAEIVHIVVG